eukprot:354619-Chlamydomonas_euryale.AAC.12
MQLQDRQADRCNTMCAQLTFRACRAAHRHHHTASQSLILLTALGRRALVTPALVIHASKSCSHVDSRMGACPHGPAWRGEPHGLSMRVAIHRFAGDPVQGPATEIHRVWHIGPLLHGRSAGLQRRVRASCGERLACACARIWIPNAPLAGSSIETPCSRSGPQPCDANSVPARRGVNLSLFGATIDAMPCRSITLTRATPSSFHASPWGQERSRHVGTKSLRAPRASPSVDITTASSQSLVSSTAICPHP